MRSATCSTAALLRDTLSACRSISGISAIFLMLLVSGCTLPACGQQMKLLSPRAGWVRYLDTLYFTHDNGEHWADITPRAPGVPKSATFGYVFFRDTSEGWAISSYAEPLSSLTQQTLNDRKVISSVMHTENGGESWSATPLVYPEPPEWVEETGAAPASLFFLDSMHGWMDIEFTGLARTGKLLMTDDGGRTWSWASSSPLHSGPICFTSPNDGWLISNGGADELYTTHDGAKSWQEVVLAPPSGMGAVRTTFQELPLFQDSRNGYLAVSYSGAEGTPAKLVVYVTRSSGKHWQPLKTLSVPAQSPFTLADSVLVLPTVSTKPGELATATISLTDQSPPVKHTYGDGVRALSFADATSGWALNSNGRLYMTSDGGSTWKDIDPSARPKSSVTIQAPTNTSTLSITSDSSLLAQSGAKTGTGSNAHLSKHLGFDKSYVQTTTAMATWWKWSPYYDASLYLPGALNRPKADMNLTAVWVSTVQAQGWGLIPIWVGQQAPCANASFPYEFTATNAASLGKSEADSAAAAASQLGVANSIIYKDIENYLTTNTQCGAAVTAYVGAWVGELHTLGYLAGVYTNPAPAQLNVATASPLPDAIWVAKYPVPPADGKATIWGLSPLPDNPWPSNQRMHQYQNYNATSTGETYGGIAFVCPVDCIDRDIDDAPIAGGNGVKTYSSWTFNFIHNGDVPPDSELLSANDKYMGQNDTTTGIPMLPQFTGLYCTGGCSNPLDPSQDIGFWWDKGTFNSTGSAIAGLTMAEQINDVGVIAIIDHATQQSPATGYLLNVAQTTATASPLSAPSSWNALSISPSGVNDAGEVAGVWYGSGYQNGFFVDAQGNWSSVSHSGAQETFLNRINGLGQVAGIWTTRNGVAGGFIYSKADGFTDITCPSGYNEIDVDAINNNGQVVGSCETLDSNNMVTSEMMFIYDLAHNAFSTIRNAVLGPIPGYGFIKPMGINDENIVVGFCQNNPCTTNVTDGFYVIPAP